MSPADARGQEGGPAPAGLIHQNENWWAYRGPKDDQEREQLLGLSFEPSIAMEGRLVVREKHPDLYRMLPIDERARVDDYARRRDARLRQGPPVTLPQIDVERIDRAAEVLRVEPEPPSAIGAAMDRGRDGFRAAVAEQRWTDVMEAWTAWLTDVAKVKARVNRFARARAELGLLGNEFIVHPPAFIDELGRAMEVLGQRIFAEAER